MLETLRKTKIENEKEPIDANANVITENVKADHPGDKLNKKETKPKRTPITWPWIVKDGWKKSKSRIFFEKKKKKEDNQHVRILFIWNFKKNILKTYNIEYTRIRYH